MSPLPVRLLLVVAALLGALVTAPPAATAAPGDRLTERSDDFAVRWGRAVNRRDWAQVRATSGPGVRRHLGELRALRRGTTLPLTRNCERLTGVPADQRVCTYGHVLEVTVVRTDSGVLRMRSFAIYR